MPVLVVPGKRLSKYVIVKRLSNYEKNCEYTHRNLSRFFDIGLVIEIRQTLLYSDWTCQNLIFFSRRTQSDSVSHHRNPSLSDILDSVRPLRTQSSSDFQVPRGTYNGVRRGLMESDGIGCKISIICTKTRKTKQKLSG